MTRRAMLTALIAGAMCHFASAQDIDKMAPVVVKTVPEAGTKDVAPGVTEIKVTFSKDMQDQSWSWASAWKDSTPKGDDKPRHESDHRTCILKVKLEPNKAYGFWINSQSFHGFQDTEGHAAIPYFFVFQTKGE